MPWTPLGELTAPPRHPGWIWGEIKKGRGGKWKGGKERTRGDEREKEVRKG